MNCGYTLVVVDRFKRKKKSRSIHLSTLKGFLFGVFIQEKNWGMSFHFSFILVQRSPLQNKVINTKKACREEKEGKEGGGKERVIKSNQQ